jgi:hypothetical protein
VQKPISKQWVDFQRFFFQHFFMYQSTNITRNITQKPNWTKSALASKHRTVDHHHWVNFASLSRVFSLLFLLIL